MIRNRQAALIDVGIRVNGWYVERASYEDEPAQLGMKGVDTLGMDIVAKYDRTVVS